MKGFRAFSVQGGFRGFVLGIKGLVLGIRVWLAVLKINGSEGSASEMKKQLWLTVQVISRSTAIASSLLLSGSCKLV